MTTLKNKSISLVAVGLIAGSLSGCGDQAELLCGPCGTIATGQLSISGDARLDGFFSAVADLGTASATLRGNFEAELRALGDIYGMGDASIDAAFVTDLIANIRADINGSVSGSLTLQYQPPRCSANVSVAVEAQASCEASAECEVEVDPGMASVQCMGSCEGSCEGEVGCSADATIICNPPEGSVGCDIGCSGTCELSAAAACEGTCRGTCSGECSLVNAEGECEGQCDGMCEGSCEASAGGECNGTCHGTCEASVTPPGCEADVDIQCGGGGSCMGSCSGGCAGEFEPPSASADCEASAECNAQASAQAEANVECTPPSLEFAFELDASLDASARAEFLGRMELLRVHLAGAVGAAAQAQALFTGEVDGEVLFEVSPVARILGELQGFASADAIADFDIPAGRLPCVIPAFEEAITVMGDTGANLQFTAEASVDLFAFVGNPTG